MRIDCRNNMKLIWAPGLKMRLAGLILGVTTSIASLVFATDLANPSEPLSPTSSAIGPAISDAATTVTGPDYWPPEALPIRAAVLDWASEGIAVGSGNVWGESWSKRDVVIPFIIILPTQTDDTWFMLRSEQNFLISGNSVPAYCDGTVVGGSSPTPIPFGVPNYYIPYLESTLHPRNLGRFADRENLLQHQTLPWPEWTQYERMKAYCIQHGFPIYRTTYDGLLIGAFTPAGYPFGETPLPFDYVFNRTEDPDSFDPNVPPPIYFIDTLDGLPPRKDGTNLSTISLNSSSQFFYGQFFVAANFKFDGGGDSPTLDLPQKPDKTIGAPITDCRLFGLLHSYGEIATRSPANIYGAISAERGFPDGAVGDVYFATNLWIPKDGPGIPFVHFRDAASTFTESLSEIQIPVDLSRFPFHRVEVDIAPIGGTALLGVDYTLTTTTLHFDIGQTEGFLEILSLPDGVPDGTQTIVLGLQSPHGALLDSPTTHTLHLLDGDLPTSPSSKAAWVAF